MLYGYVGKLLLSSPHTSKKTLSPDIIIPANGLELVFLY